MITKGQEISAGTVLQCDVCIVGSGPAGITIATEMLGRSDRVVLLESGDWKESTQSRDMLRGYVWPEDSHEPLDDNRRRQFGGSSVAWGGRCVPLDPIDFEARPWVPFSGWPFAANELDTYYSRATTLCEAGRPAFDAAIVFPDRQREMILGFDGRHVNSSTLERWGPPTNFARRYGKALDRADNVKVLLNTTLLHLHMNRSDRKIEKATVAVDSSHQFSVQAGRFVLACGGLENARLLLASNDVIASGIGNESDKLGRYYMSHITGTDAWAKLRNPEQGFLYDFERDSGVFVRRRFWITGQAQRENSIGNAIASFTSPYIDHSTDENALMSATYLAKFALGLARRGKGNRLSNLIQSRQMLLRHLKTVTIRAPVLIPQIIDIVRQRYLTTRRLPILLPRKKDLKNRFDLFYQVEHAPNPESRVVLHSEQDSLGLPRLEVRIAFTDLDVRTVTQAHKLIQTEFRRSGAGELIFDEAALDAAVRTRLRNFHSAAHHMGTTRMSEDPLDGVVDRNCRVHGTQNLFVAGSSIFPTGGHANPTLTLVAMAVRLADYLKANSGPGHACCAIPQVPSSQVLVVRKDVF